MNTKNNAIYGHLSSLYYDAMEGCANNSEVDFYATFLNNTMHILEAMSGSGRLQIPLLQKGFCIDGADNSVSMLKQCKQRLEELNLTAKLYLQDVSSLHLDQQYHTIIIAKGSFQLLDKATTATRTLDAMQAHMHTGGILLLELFIPDHTLHNQHLTSLAIVNAETAIRLTRSYSFDQNAQSVQVTCSYELLQNNVVEKTENELMHFAWYTENEISDKLTQAGFTIIAHHVPSFYPNERAHVIEAQKISSK